MRISFINTSKYTKIQSSQGTEPALKKLMKDIGSTGKIVTYTPPLHPNSVGACITDVTVALDAEKLVGGMLRGLGHTKKEALTNLFTKLLRPSKAVTYEAPKARLCVGGLFNPNRVLIKVEPQ